MDDVICRLTSKGGEETYTTREDLRATTIHYINTTIFQEALEELQMF